MSGKVKAICTAGESRALQKQHTSAQVVAGSGIVGDRYFGRNDEPGQNITFVELEEIEHFKEKHSVDASIIATRRNIITHGVRLNDFVGREFKVGEVRFRGVELCEPCRSMGTNLSSENVSVAQVVAEFVHKAGLRADALTSGAISVGDSIAACD